MHSVSSLVFIVWVRNTTPTFGWRGREKFLVNSSAFDGDANDITFSVNCLDDARTPSIVAEDLAQPADAHVDAAIERPRVASACELDQLGARDHAVALREQRRQHAVFGGAQRRGSAVRRVQLARDDVEAPAAEAERAGSRRRRAI